MLSAAKKRVNELILTLPSFAWLVMFFVIPTVIVLAMAFRKADPFGGIGSEWTLQTLRELSNPSYPRIIWRTVYLSVAATAICLLLAVPCGYYIARAKDKWRDILLLMVIVPFWTNFLIRIFAWKTFLHPEGLFKQALVYLHLVSESSLLLYRPETVLVVLIYTYLPFAILPIYAAAEKFDFGLLEAANDLGASSWQAFYKIFLPGISSGLLTALAIVFIPALGSYVIPDIVGGPSGEMLGNKIAQRTFVDRNLPHASALSALLTLAVLLPMAGGLIFKSRKSVSSRKSSSEDEE